MLSNVLPGLREVRAPLTAGYMWLIAAWLLFHSSIPTAAEAQGGPLEPFFDLGGVVSSFGLAVVLSVLAYLIGSLSEGIFQLPLRVGARRFGGGPTWELSWRGAWSLVSLVQDRAGRVRGRLEDKGLYLRDLVEYQELAESVEREFDFLNSAEFVYTGFDDLDAGSNNPQGLGSYRLMKAWAGADKQHSEPVPPSWVKYEGGGGPPKDVGVEESPRDRAWVGPAIRGCESLRVLQPGSDHGESGYEKE